MSHQRYKVSEAFYSLQGEGRWTGYPMFFVRLSQCPVGGAEGICKSWDGKEFICDTGLSYKGAKAEHHPYTQVSMVLTAEQIWEMAKERSNFTPTQKHLCITGGEPLIYNLEDLIYTCPDNWMIHIETSGTVRQILAGCDLWVTVSPKEGYDAKWIESFADELKILVHQGTDNINFFKLVSLAERVYFQPIESELREETVANAKRAVELALKYGLPLSLQTHKILEIR